MGFDWDKSDLESSSVLKASHLNDGIDAIQDFVNEGIGKTELKDATTEGIPGADPYTEKGWVNSKLIYRPEFYGSPSPRMMAVSGQTHFREVNESLTNSVCFQADVSGAAYTGVPNASTRIKLRHSATVNIMCSFYMFEMGGVNLSPIRDAHGRGYESYLAGNAYIEIDGHRYSETKRSIYTSNVLPDTYLNYFPGVDAGDGVKDVFFTRIHQQQGGYLILPMIGRHQHHISLQIDLSPGIHDIGLVFKPRPQAEEPSVPVQDKLSWGTRPPDTGEYNNYNIFYGVSWDERPKMNRRKNIFFSARNLVVDCYYNDNEWYDETS